MRVGIYFPSVWAPGGVGTYIRRAGDWLRDAGHEIFYLTGASDPRLVDEDGRVAEGVESGEPLLRRAAALRLDVLNVHCEVDADLVRSPVPVVRTVLGHHPYCPSGSRFLKRWERPCDRRFHVVGCTWGHVVDRCGSVRPHKLLANLSRPRLERRTLRGVRVVAISEFVRSNMVAEGYDPAVIDLIHLPIRGVWSESVERIEADGPPRVVFAGRMSPEKGVAWLVRALARTTSGAVLDLAGEGDVEAEVRALIDDLGLVPRVTWHGWLDERAIDTLLAQARMVVFPSLWHEPAGLVAPEAMAQGVAVIGSAVGGIPETVRHEHNGLLVRPNDVSGLAAAIDRLATDATLARRLGDAGRRDAAERFGLDGHMRRLLAVYDKAISDRTNRSTATAADV